ncbi:DNA polymerase epsilon subunit 3 [Cryptosporidium sp. chipmunk genotype I]|uniref:DNA polymerase epsilon subunit 3 n=1 Tax=Cryptosporidium sp. chipmunk genotype I TaxID=1280935 RepID=UPI00351A1F1A|nr:DNA polymerase epsilon subunit 3 [Cryptosporidium sp. chipmunk genotype I]
MTINEEKASNFQFPDSTISRIVKSVVSSNSRMSKDACKTINRCATLFSIYLTSLSSSSDGKKSTVHDYNVKSALKFIYSKNNASR